MKDKKKVFLDLDKTIFSNKASVYKHNKGILIVDDFRMKKMTKLNTYIVWFPERNRLTEWLVMDLFYPLLIPIRV